MDFGAKPLAVKCSLPLKMSHGHSVSAIYTHVLSDTYRVKVKKTMSARLLNFSKQLIKRIISESNGFTELKIL